MAIPTPTVEDMRKHVDTVLTDAALADVIAACVAAVNERAPDVDTARGKLAVIQLVKLELLTDGLQEYSDGDYSERRAFSGREREAILRSLTRGRAARVLT